MTLDLAQLLTSTGVSALTAFSTTTTTAEALRRYVAALNGAGPLDAEAARLAAVRDMKAHDVRDAHRLAAAAFAERREGSSAAKAELQGQAVAFTDVEPAPGLVDGADLLDRIHAFIGRFLSLPQGADVLLTVFVVYTYAVERFDAATYIVLHSPAPQCGKTRALEVLEALVRRAWRTIAPSTAVLFRVLEQFGPALLLDEAEVVHGRGDAAADVRALLQSGYRRGAFVPRCVGEAFEVRNFRVFGPKVFALIGDLPAALFDRCIPVEMQRRARAEAPEKFRRQRLEAEALVLRQQARRWVADHQDTLGQVEVPALEFLDERSEEVWEPLFAVGMVAGGGWYERLLQAAMALSGGRATSSVGVELLSDIYAVFVARGVDRLWSADLAIALNEMEGHRWADWHRGKGITANGIARLLRAFNVSPATVRLGETTAKGYLREKFESTWAQYTPAATVTPAQPSQDGPYLADGNRNAQNAVTVANGEFVAEFGHCDGVTVQKQGGEGLEDSDPDAEVPAHLSDLWSGVPMASEPALDARCPNCNMLMTDWATHLGLPSPRWVCAFCDPTTQAAYREQAAARPADSVITSMDAGDAWEPPA